jgi:DNA-binding phage protein
VATREVKLIFNDKDSEAAMSRLTQKITALQSSFEGLAAKTQPVANAISRIARYSGQASAVGDMAKAVGSLGVNAGKAPATLGRIADALSRIGATAKTSKQDILDVVNGIGKLVNSVQTMQSTSTAGFGKAIKSATRATGAAAPITGGGGTSAKAITDVGDAARRSGSLMAGFAQHSDRVNRGLLHVQSAAAGAMGGMALLNKQFTGLAFTFLFARFNELPMMFTSMALTVVLGGLAKTLSAVARAAVTMGKTFEASGQQMASYLRSAKAAMNVKAEADQLARQTGMAREDLEKTIMYLERYGLNSQTYVSGLMEIASATGEKLSTVSGDFIAILKADGDQQANLVKRFVRDYDLPAKAYTNTLDLMTAANERYKGATKAAADTTAGWWERVKASTSSLIQRVGVLVNETIKPLLQMLQAFFEGAIAGFNEMFAAGMKSGDVTRTITSLREAVQRALPYIMELGRLFGRFLYYSAIYAAKAIKVLIDTILALWQRLKPLLDIVRNILQKIKDLVEWLISWYKRHKELVDVILGAYLAMLLFNTAIEKGPALISALEKSIAGLVKTVLSVPEDFFKNLDKILGGPTGKLKEPTPGGGESTAVAIIREIIKGFASGAVGGLVVGLMSSGLAGSILGAIGAALVAVGAAIGSTAAAVAILVTAIIALIVGALLFPKHAGTVAGTLASLFINAIVLLPILMINAWVGFAKWLIGNVTKMLGDIKDIVVSLFEGDIGGAFSAAWDLIKTLFDTITLGLFTKVKDWLIDIGKAVFGWDILDKFKGALGAVWNFLTGWWGDFSEGFANSFDIGPAIDGIKSLFDDKLVPAAQAVESAFWWAWDRMKSFGGWIGDFTGGMFGEIASGIAAGAKKIEDAFWWAADRVKSLYDLIRNPPNPVGFVGGLWKKATGLVTETFGGTIPSYAAMGTVPGRVGSRRLVLAEAGERFLGAPGFADSRARSYGSPPAGGIIINIDLTGSTISGDQAMNDLADKVSGRIMNRLGGGRQFSLHRV